MKKIIITTLLSLVLLFVSNTVFADTIIHLDIETSTGTLYNQDINITPCDSDNNPVTPDEITAYCAVLQSGLTNDWLWFGTDAFLNSISGVSNNDGNNGIYWGWFSNLNLGQTALNKYTLNSGDSILLNYNINPLNISVDKQTPSVGENIKFTVTEFSYDSSFNPVWSLASGGQIAVGSDTFVLDGNGTYTFKVIDTNTINVKAEKSGFIDTPTIVISPTQAIEKVLVRNGDTIIYSGDVLLPVSATISIPDKSGTTHDVNTNSVLAILYSLTQVADPSFMISDLQYYDSFGAFYLKCITPKGGTELCDNWQYNVNNITPFTGMDTTILSGGESVGLYFGSSHKLTLDKNSIFSGESIGVETSKYNYLDNTWGILTGVNIDLTKPNPSDPWNPTFVSTTPVDVDGKASITLNDVGDYTLGIKEDYSFPSYSVNVKAPVGVGGGGGGSTQTSVSISKALDFLASKQNANGSFGDMLYTDWTAIAIAGAGSQAQDMKSKISLYFKNTPFQSSILTDNERHAMALMSLGINPYSGTSVNYISQIVSSYDGTQFGDSSLYNDDIFALIVLANAGYSSSDEIIKKDIEYVISRQSSDGSWGSVDMTSAGIQALRNFTNVADVSQAISKGEGYLASSQNTDGGFGNSFSTSWALQAMSLNSSFGVQIAKADKYLASLQQTDGGIDITSIPTESRIWATAYAIPATLHLSWSNILQSFSKPTTSLGTSGALPTVLPQSPIIEPKDEIKIIDKKIDEIKILNKETLPKIKKAKVKKPQIVKENINLQDKDINNSLGASAGGALSDQGIKPPVIHRIVDLIKSPFIWLFKKLGF